MSAYQRQQELFKGHFTLDPYSEEFKGLKNACIPGNPSKCLIAAAAKLHFHIRMAVHVNHSTMTGRLGFTIGDYRYERPMTVAEVDFAVRFDNNDTIRSPVTVMIDTDQVGPNGQLVWTRRPKIVKVRKPGHKDPKSGKYPADHKDHISKRKKTFDAIVREHARRQQQAESGTTIDG